MLCLVDFPGKTDLFLKKNGGGVDLGKGNIAGRTGRNYGRVDWLGYIV